MIITRLAYSTVKRLLLCMLLPRNVLSNGPIRQSPSHYAVYSVLATSMACFSVYFSLLFFFFAYTSKLFPLVKPFGYHSVEASVLVDNDCYYSTIPRSIGNVAVSYF